MKKRRRRHLASAACPPQSCEVFLITSSWQKGIFKGMWAPWRADWPRKEIEVKLCRHLWSLITSMIIIALRLWWSHYDNQWSLMITSMIISSITQTENLHWESMLTLVPPTFSERLTIQVNIKTCLLINNIVNTCLDIFTMNSFKNGRWCLRRTSTGWWWGGWIKMTRCWFKDDHDDDRCQFAILWQKLSNIRSHHRT